MKQDIISRTTSVLQNLINKPQTNAQQTNKTNPQTLTSKQQAQVFGYPVAGATVSQAFGHRPTNPNIRYESGTNLGTDFAAASGSAINSPVGGTVLGINPGAGAWGNQVIIDAGDGRQVAFNHLSGFGKIKKGQTIKAGDVLGQVGSTGQTTGSHLDMEATVNGTSVPLEIAFKGYQFDPAYKGATLSEKGAQGYNRSQDKFYDPNDLSKSTGSVYSSGSGGPASSGTTPSDSSEMRSRAMFDAPPTDVNATTSYGVTSTKPAGAIGIDVNG
jgi:murein DD-endopeptidase MepM/ murein hydrolase activator NlpD